MRKNPANIILLLINICAVLLISASTVRGNPLILPEADLPAGGYRAHPDGELSLAGDKFNIFIETAMPDEWTLEASHIGTPGMGTMDVIMYSQVWRHDDGHLLFAYKVENNSSSCVRLGNIGGYGAAVCDITDSGILHFGGNATFVQGDILELSRSSIESQLAFAFEAIDTSGETIEKLLLPGETSQWFYIETDAVKYGYGLSSVIDGGASADMMEVLIPIPEPATIALLTIGVIGVIMCRK